MENTIFTRSATIFYMDAQSELVQLLSAELGKRNLSNRDAARTMGLSHPTLGSILAGDQPSFESCQKISRFLRLPLVSVLSMAGYIPRVEKSTAEEEQLLYLFRQMNEDQRRDLLLYADFKLSR